MGRMGIRQLAAIAAVTAAALAGSGGSTASASVRPAHPMVFTPRALALMAPKVGLLHSLAATLPGATSPSLDSLSLFSDPIPLTVNGVTYRMDMFVGNPPVSFDEPPQLAVELDRTTSAGSLINGEQYHVYGYAPIGGLQFTADSGLTKAHVDTGSSIDPSAVDMQFKAAGPVQQVPCTLALGGRGTFQVASGTLTSNRFSIATDTFPFFATIAAPPTRATVVHDPGCSNFLAASAIRPVYHAPCGGRVTVIHSTLRSFWYSEPGFGGRRLTQFGIVQTNPFGPAGVGHLAAGLGPGADTPRIAHLSGGRVRAYVRTRGVPFMGGRALFRSSGRVRVTHGHTCVWERHFYHFSTTRYRGTLTPAGSPLRMLFDTGAEPVTGRAFMYVRTYRKA